MLQVACLSCQSPYSLDEARIPEKGMRMRCPKCGTSFVVHKNGSVEAASASPNRPVPQPSASAPTTTSTPNPVSFNVETTKPLFAPPPSGEPRKFEAQPTEELDVDLPTSAFSLDLGPRKAPSAAPPPAPPSFAQPSSVQPSSGPAGKPAFPRPQGARPASPTSQSQSTGILDLPTPKRPLGEGSSAGNFSAPKAPPPPRSLKDRLSQAEGDPLQLADLPAPKVEVDLPQVLEPPAAKPLVKKAGAFELDMELDLPAAVTADLPRSKLNPMDENIDLPARSGVDLPAAFAIDLPGLAENLPMPKAGPNFGDAGFGDLDLPMPGGVVDLPTPLESLPMPKAHGREAAPSIELDLPGVPDSYSSGGNNPSPFGSSAFGDLDLPLPAQSKNASASNDDIDLGFVGAPAASGNIDMSHDLDDFAPVAQRGHGQAAVGANAGDELSLELAPAAAPNTVASNAQKPAVATKSKQAKAARKPRKVWPAIVAGAIVLAAGAAIPFTPLAPILREQFESFLPGQGDAGTVAQALQSAEQDLFLDTSEAAQRALVLLGNTRRDAGLNRRLITRSLTYENYVLARYGGEPGSRDRAAAIRHRVDERKVRGFELRFALASNELAMGNAVEAKRRLMLLRDQGAVAELPIFDLLLGEACLQSNDAAGAKAAFQNAVTKNGGAAARFGYARALMAAGETAQVESVLRTVLQASPRHIDARLLAARLLASNDKADEAIALIDEVAGLSLVDEQVLPALASQRAEAFLLAGELHERLGRLQRARRSFESAMNADPHLLPAIFGAARTALLESPADALARFEAIVNMGNEGAQNPDSEFEPGQSYRSAARLGSARALLSLGRPSEAQAKLAVLAQERANDPVVAYWLGQVEERMQRVQEAERLYRESIRLAPTTFDAYLALARLYLNTEREPDAEAAIAQAVQQVAESASMREGLGQFELSRGHLDIAIQHLQRALELENNRPSTLFALGAAQRRNRQLDMATQTFETLGSLDPGYPGLALERGLLFEASGDAPRAVAFYQQALDQDASNPELQLRLGAAQVSANMLDEAEASLAKAKEEMPNSAEVEHFQGRLELLRDHPAEAGTHFDRAIELDGSRGEYYAYSARAAMLTGALGKATERVGLALSRDQTLYDAFLVRGIVHLRTGAVRDAVNDLQQSLALNPNAVEALAYLGECYDQLRKLPEAINSYRLALEVQPEHGDWWYRYGRILLDSGDRDGGQRALVRATEAGDAREQRPGWLPEAHRLLGDAMSLSGNRTGAIAQYRIFLETADENSIDRRAVETQLRAWGALAEED